MGITRQQPGAAKAAATAGAAIGAGQKAVREQAEAAALKRQQMQIGAREAAEKRAFQWEQQKMEINSQRAFERELRVEDYRLLAEDRSAERAIERIEFSKDLDFQYKTQERQRKRTVLDSDIAALDKAIEKGDHTEDELAVQNKRTEFEQRRIAIEMDAPWRGFPKEQKPRSATSQVSEIDAATELDSFTQQDLIDVGLDPADFPGVKGENAAEYVVGQIIQTPQGDMEVVGFDEDGEPLVDEVGSKPIPESGFRGAGATGSFRLPGDPTVGSRIKSIFSYKPFANILKGANVPFGDKGK